MKQACKTRILSLAALACLLAASGLQSAAARTNLALASNGAVATQKDNLGPTSYLAPLANDGVMTPASSPTDTAHTHSRQLKERMMDIACWLWAKQNFHKCPHMLR